jgi:O-antigen/teichoic acid export membrane protein
MIVSAGGNAVRAVLGLLSGLIVARGLGPSGYGDLMFLIVTMTAVQIALQMGSSNAFYTFLSQSSRTLSFYLFYYAWLLIQLALSLLIVLIIISDEIVEDIWIGQTREIVAVTVVAVFMQRIVWPMVGQIGESSRQTAKVQILNTAAAVVYMAIVSILYLSNALSVEAILLTLIGQFTVATVLSYWVLKESDSPKEGKELSIRLMAKAYWDYCKPLIVLSVAAFLYAFLDRWMLQKFSGSAEQAYFQVGFQISTISLLATTSILAIFWKEIAEAWGKNNQATVARMYRKVNRGRVILTAVITGLLLPWAEQIVLAALGDEYVRGWPVLALMLFYPIHQSMGQIGSSMLLATGNTYKHMLVSVATIMISIPVTYFVLAPTDASFLPGLEMGALGIAIKMVVIGFVSVNIQAWVITRICGWRFDWLFQAIGIPIMIGIGYLAGFLASHVIVVSEPGILTLIGSLGLSSAIHFLLVGITIFNLPWLIGFEKDEVKYVVRRALRILKQLA